MNRKNNFFAILIAAGIGYLGGLLLAPKKGEETRKDIKKSAIRFKKDAENNINKAVDTVRENYDEVSKKVMGTVEDIKEDKKDYIENAKEEVLKILDTVEKESKKAKKEVKKSDIEDIADDM